MCTSQDKNLSPGAEDAFKRLKLAVDTLTDPQMKQKYDNSLEEAGRVRAAANAARESSARFYRMAKDAMAQKEAAAKAATQHPDPSAKERLRVFLNTHKVVQLRAALNSASLSLQGNKAALIERLAETFVLYAFPPPGLHHLSSSVSFSLLHVTVRALSLLSP